jgi:hypothetical protein
MSMTTLKPGPYALIITGPTGEPIYSQTVVMEERQLPKVTLNRQYLKELLEVTSIAQGNVEWELEQQRGGQGA